MIEVVVLVFDDCEPSAVAAVIEALSIANFHWSVANGAEAPPFAWRTISFDGKPVRTIGDIRLAPDGSSETLQHPDLIFVPGIRGNDLREMDRSVRRLSTQWKDALIDHYGRNGYLAAACSGVFVLAEAGLLDGRVATTSWFLSRHFQSRYPRVRLAREMLFTNEERIFCSAAFSACFNLGHEIVAEFLGPRAALSLARVMFVDVNRTAQMPYANLLHGIKHNDDLVLRAQAFLLNDIRRALDLERLADRLHVTSHTLNRRFKKAIGETPLSFLQNARVERAKRLLETTNVSLDQIVCRVGYEDASSFRRLFVQTTGVSPREYRKRFGKRRLSA